MLLEGFPICRKHLVVMARACTDICEQDTARKQGCIVGQGHIAWTESSNQVFPQRLPRNQLELTKKMALVLQASESVGKDPCNFVDPQPNGFLWICGELLLSDLLQALDHPA